MATAYLQRPVIRGNRRGMRTASSVPAWHSESNLMFYRQGCVAAQHPPFLKRTNDSTVSGVSLSGCNQSAPIVLTVPYILLVESPSIQIDAYAIGKVEKPKVTLLAPLPVVKPFGRSARQREGIPVKLFCGFENLIVQLFLKETLRLFRVLMRITSTNDESLIIYPGMS